MDATTVHILPAEERFEPVKFAAEDQPQVLEVFAILNERHGSGVLKDSNNRIGLPREGVVLPAGTYSFERTRTFAGIQPSWPTPVTAPGDSGLLARWAHATHPYALPLHRVGYESAAFRSWHEEHRDTLDIVVPRLRLKLGRTLREPDAGPQGSYTFLGRCLKSLIEVVAALEDAKFDPLSPVPPDPSVEGPLLEVEHLVIVELKSAQGAGLDVRLRIGEAQLNGAAELVARDCGLRRTLVVGAVSDGFNIRANRTWMSLVEGDLRREVFVGMLPMVSAAGGNVRPLDMSSPGYMEFLFLAWLSWRERLGLSAGGPREEVPFRPGDVLKVAGTTCSPAVEVVQPLKPPREEGGVYLIRGLQGLGTSEQLVLKHGGCPARLEELRTRGVGILHWYQVLREREALLQLQLGDSDTPCLPRLHAAGKLAPPLPAGAAKLEGADVVVTGPFGKPLPPLPLPSQDITVAAADLAEAVLTLQLRGVYHNDVRIPNIVLQPGSSPARPRFQLLDLGAAACSRLDAPEVAQLLNPSGFGSLAHRASVLDLMFGSLHSLLKGAAPLEFTSDLQSVVFVLVVMAGGELPWAEAAGAGDAAEALCLREQALCRRSIASWPPLASLPDLVRVFAVWVLERAARSRPGDMEELCGWHRRLRAAADGSASRMPPALQQAAETAEAPMVPTPDQREGPRRVHGGEQVSGR